MPARSLNMEPGAEAWTPGVWADSEPGDGTELLERDRALMEQPARIDALSTPASPVMMVRRLSLTSRASQSVVD